MVNELLNKQKEYFYQGHTRDVDWRIAQLKKLKAAIIKYEPAIVKALYEDLRKPEFEAYATEVGFVLDSIGHTIKNLHGWAKPLKVKTPIHQPFSKSYVLYEPYGVTLVISPFNYPFQLSIEPLVGAIAAGNTVILKPSEYTTATEALLETLIREVFEPEYVTVVTGGKEVVTELIHAPFDYIFFTGSVPVGKVVMKAAAENLVPVTLELGGKSPTVVHSDANLKIAAKRIVWGKFMNAGQICVAPDYIYVQESVKEAFIKEVCEQVLAFYGAMPKDSEDYCRIVNERQFDRLVTLIHHDKVVMGGQYDREDLYIAPTIMKDITWDDAVMSDEIFGPLMPILTYNHLDEVIKAVNARPKPLAFYIFTESHEVSKLMHEKISFGGGCINDTVSHVASSYMSFGGVGHSGLGGYHGEHSFGTFSHAKSILKKSTQFDMKLIYPPYKDRVGWVKKLMK